MRYRRQASAVPVDNLCPAMLLSSSRQLAKRATINRQNIRFLSPSALEQVFIGWAALPIECKLRLTRRPLQEGRLEALWPIGLELEDDLQRYLRVRLFNNEL